MKNRDLPDIVSQIREQRPELLSEWLKDNPTNDYYMWEDWGGHDMRLIGQRAAIRIVEADLWREYAANAKTANAGGCYWNWDSREWAAFGRDTPTHYFHNEPLSLIRALCHAIGVTLKAI